MKLKLLAVAVAAAITTPAAFAETEVSTKAGSGMTVKTGDTSINIGGRIQLDADWFDGDAYSGSDDSGSDTEVRRARLFAKGKIGKNWEAKIRANFKSGKTDVDEAWVKFKGWDFADLTIGTHKANFGLEQQTSSKDITAIERTMATNAFAIGNEMGIALGKGNNDYTWGVGVYDLGDEGDHVATGITGRLTFSPINTKEEVLHLGVGFNKQRVEGDEWGVSERLEVHTADYKFKTDFATQSVEIFNVEAAYAIGSFHAQAEYFDASTDNGDASGYYAQLGYILTGESRPYSKGKFKRVKPKGKDGAWELMYRYSTLDTTNGLVFGDEAKAHTFGVNYYANNAIRVGLNYVTSDVKRADLDGDAIAVRVQYVF
ncbi:MAG: porin [Gammaproteobacteria bacterium]|nr:porin [Gammaproteobacteria bacterium]